MKEIKPLIYMDNAATTPTRPEVVNIMTEYMTEKFGNPSSLYSIARDSREAVTKAREQAASAINAKPKRYISHPAERILTTGQ